MPVVVVVAVGVVAVVGFELEHADKTMTRAAAMAAHDIIRLCFVLITGDFDVDIHISTFC